MLITIVGSANGVFLSHYLFAFSTNFFLMLLFPDDQKVTVSSDLKLRAIVYVLDLPNTRSMLEKIQ